MRLLMRASLILLLVGLAFTTPAAAQINYLNWSGGGSDDLFVNTANWLGTPIGGIGDAWNITDPGVGYYPPRIQSTDSITATRINIGFNWDGVDINTATYSPGQLTMEGGIVNLVNGTGSTDLSQLFVNGTLTMLSGQINNIGDGVNPMTGYNVNIGVNGLSAKLEMSTDASINDAAGYFFVGAYGGATGEVIMHRDPLGVYSPSINVGGMLMIGEGGVGTFTQESGDVTVANEFRLGVSGGSGNYALESGNLTANSHVRIGYEGGTGSFTMTDGQYSVAGWFQIGENDSNTTQKAVGSFQMDGGSLAITGGSAQNLTVGFNNPWTANGAQGTWTQTGGMVTCSDQLWIGRYQNADGTFNMTGGEFNSTAYVGIGMNYGVGRMSLTNAIFSNTEDFVIGFGAARGDVTVANSDLTVGTLWVSNGGTATLDISGTSRVIGNTADTIHSVGSGDTWYWQFGTYIPGYGTVTVSDSAEVTLSGYLFLGRAGGQAVWNQNGGTTTVSEVDFGEQYSNTVLNLNGGVFAAHSIWGQWWYDTNPVGSVINFNGGTLKLLEDMGEMVVATHANFHAYMLAAGGTIDTDGHNVVVNVPLEAPVSGASGGLTKTGLGALTLAASCTYTGATTIDQGSLVIRRDITLASPSVAVAAAGTLNVTRGSIQSLDLSSLDLADGSTLVLNVTADGTDLANAIHVLKGGAGTLTLPTPGTANVVLSPLGTKFDSSYTLVDYNTRLGGDATNVSVTVDPTTRATVGTVTEVVGSTSSALVVTVTNVSKNLTWFGDTTSGSTSVGTWATGRTDTLWIDGTTPPPTENFYNLDAVTFDDTSLYDKTVTISGKVQPASIAVGGTTSTTFDGSGYIAGEGVEITKTGSGTLSINNTGDNSFTGLTVSAGAVSFGHSWNTGHGPSQKLYIANGASVTVAGQFFSAFDRDTETTITLDGNLTGGAILTTGTTTERGWVQLAYGANSKVHLSISGYSTFDSQEPIGFCTGPGSSGDLTMTGPSQLKSTSEIRLGAGGVFTATLSDTASIESGPNLHMALWGGTSTVTLNAGTSIKVNSGEFYMGLAGGNATLNMHSGTVTVVDNCANIGRDDWAGGPNQGQGVVHMDGDSRFDVNQEFRLGWRYGKGTLTMADTSALTAKNLYNVGRDAGSVAYIELNDTASIVTNGTGGDDALNFGSNNGTATVVMNDDSQMATGKWASIGRDAGSVATLTMGAPASLDLASFTCQSWFNIGCWGWAQGTVTMNGYTTLDAAVSDAYAWASLGQQGTGRLFLNDVTRATASGYGWNLADTGGTAQVVINDAATLEGANILMGGASSTIDLNGGEIKTSAINGASSSVINFNGGLVQANAYTAGTNTFTPGANFLTGAQLVVLSGANIDSNGYNVTATVPFLHGGTVTDGGLNKSGSGVLAVHGVSTYDGPTAISNGGLAVRRTSGTFAPGAISVTPSVTLAAGTSLDLDTSETPSQSVAHTLTSASFGAGSTLILGVNTDSTSTDNALVATAMNVSAGINLKVGATGDTVDTTGWYTVLRSPGMVGSDTDVTVSAAPTLLHGYTVVGKQTVTVGSDTLIQVQFGGALTSTALEWTAGVNSTWSAATGALNWQDSVPTAAAFLNNDSVLFGNSAGTNTTVAVDYIVRPSAITVNSTSAYTLTGPALIKGMPGATLAVNAGTLTINSNVLVDVAGAITVDGATSVLNVDSVAQLGSGNVTVSNAALLHANSVWDNPVGMSRDLTVSDTSVVSTYGMTFAQGTGTTSNISLTGSAKLTSRWLGISLGANGGTANVTMTGTNSADPVGLGQFDTAAGADCDTITLGLGPNASATLAMTGNARILTGYDLNLGCAGNSTDGGSTFAGTMTADVNGAPSIRGNYTYIGKEYSSATLLATGSNLAASTEFFVGHNHGQGTLTMVDSTLTVDGGNGNLNIGRDYGAGVVAMSGTSSISLSAGSERVARVGIWNGAGTLTVADSATVSADDIRIGTDNGTGYVDMTGGTLTTRVTGSHENFSVGWKGGNGTLTMSGTSQVLSCAVLAGRDSASNGSISITGSAKLLSCYWESKFGTNSGSATVYIDGTDSLDPAVIGSAAGALTADGDYLAFGRDSGFCNLEMHGNSIAYSSSWTDIGTQGGSAIVTMNDSARFLSTYWYGSNVSIGAWSWGYAELTMHDSANITTIGDMYIGDQGTAYVALDGSASLVASGQIRFGGDSGYCVANIDGGSITTASTLYVGANGAQGTLTATGNAAITATRLQIGYCWDTGAANGVANLGGTSTTTLTGVGEDGRIYVGGWGWGVAELNVTDHATITSAGDVVVGMATYGTLSISDSANVTINGGFVNIGHQGGVGTVSLNGGTLTAYGLVAAGAAGETVNFNGGWFRPLVGESAYGLRIVDVSGVNPGGSYLLSVLGGGAKFDMNGQTSSIAATLSNGTGGLDGGLTVTGGGSLALQATNGYTGATEVDGSTLAAQATNALGAGGPVNVRNSGTLDMAAGLNSNVGAVTLYSGAISGAGSLTSSSGFELQSGSVAANLAGAVAVNKTTSGTVNLTGTSSYSGGTNVNAGTLVASGTNALGTGPVVNTSGATLTMTAGVGSTVGAVTLGGGSIIDGSGTLTSTSGFAVTTGSASAVLDGAVGLTKTGSGTAELTGANTLTGREVVVGGVLKLGLAAQNAVLTLGGADLQSALAAGVITTTKLVFEYTDSSDDPVAAIRAALVTSYNGGVSPWTAGKFTSSTAAALGLTIGYFDDTVNHTVTVMPTYPGDFNLDGAVNTTDYGIYKAHATGSDISWQAGNGNYDSAVNTTDYLMYKANAARTPIVIPSGIGGGPAAGLGLGPVVPEPGTFALLLPILALFGYVVARRRRQ